MDRARALAATLLLVAGCRTFDPKHFATGKPPIDTKQAAMWVWYGSGTWHLRLTGGGRAHRFQGTISGVSGGVVALEPTDKQLKDRVALAGDSAQFDIETDARETGGGLDVRLAGACARFDLYLDGRYRAERVRLGPRSVQPRHMPFEICP